MNDERSQAHELIRRNIAEHGFHVYLVNGGPDPRFAYTIGLTETLGSELVLAGASLYDADEVHEIIDATARIKRLARSLGTFTLRDVHDSWCRSLLLGAFDYYKPRVIHARQIVPDKQHWAIDVPDLSRDWSAATEPVWQWLREPWPFAIDADATAMTNLDALRGAPITEACRWEPDYWEMFAGAGPDVHARDAHAVPLATLLAFDPSLRAVIDLAVGEGLWREPGAAWRPWPRTSR